MLEEIIKNKITEVETLKKTQNNSLDDILSMNIPSKSFTKSLTDKIHSGKNAIIAELKRCSPSKGYLDKNLNIKQMAQTYQDSGAACISVLTDSKYFKGSNEDLKLVKKSINIPILRKDFIIDEIQIIESKLIGADCILLIVACLSSQRLKELLDFSDKIGIDALVEVHNEQELYIALDNNCKILGINNRDLKTFDVDIQTTISLQNKIDNDDIIVISESGIKDINTIKILNENNIYAFLIGESLITDNRPAITLKNMVG
tara:strand:- start:409 stop:1188 length:780 start_codon:yes stop_codon:yes gene_type:complete